MEILYSSLWTSSPGLVTSTLPSTPSFTPSSTLTSGGVSATYSPVYSSVSTRTEINIQSKLKCLYTLLGISVYIDEMYSRVYLEEMYDGVSW